MNLMRPTMLAFALVGIGLVACKPQTSPSSAAPAQNADAAMDARLSELSQRAVEGWLKLSPVNATQIGKHDYDTEIDDLSAAGRQTVVDFSRQLLSELDAIDTSKLTRENQIDAAILSNQLRSDIWNMEPSPALPALVPPLTEKVACQIRSHNCGLDG